MSLYKKEKKNVITYVCSYVYYKDFNKNRNEYIYIKMMMFHICNHDISELNVENYIKYK